MLKKLIIRNFKAVERVEILFTPLTVLMGGNSSGKSTILQALDFLRSISMRDIQEYLDERGWGFEDLKSQFISPVNNSLQFISTYAFNESGKITEVVWDVTIDQVGGKWVIAEKIRNPKNDVIYLSRRNKEIGDLPYSFSQFNLGASALKLIDETAVPSESAGGEALAMLRLLKHFLSASSSFELLSPERMRSRGNRGHVSDIGLGGEKLPAFLHGLSSARKTELNRLLSDFMGYKVKVVTQTQEQPGWINLYLAEDFEATRQTKVKVRYVSDGLLRIIALLAIFVQGNETSRGGMILLDEIEDGINPYLVEKLVQLLKRVTRDQQRQVIVTTHSAVLVNQLESSDLFFLWRDERGSIHCKPLFSTGAMQETLEFLQPGEVWLNYSESEILEKLSTI